MDKNSKPLVYKALWIILLLLLIPSSIFFTIKRDKNMSTKITFDNMPIRKGERPATTPSNPHMQLTQQPDDLSYIKKLMDWAFTLSNIEKKPSAISVPGSVAMWMEEEHSCKRCNAFMIGHEFAHFHPHPDYSMHLGIPQKDAEIIIEKGWGEFHPMIKRNILPPNIIMMYAPRSQEELEVAKFILARSYDFAKGKIGQR